MMNARKRVGPLPTHRLDVRHSVDYSSSDHFSSDGSLRGSSLSSSSETSSDSSVDALSDYASSHSSSNHSLPSSSSGMRSSHYLCSLVPSIHRSSAAISERPSHSSYYASPSRKRSRSPVAFVPLSSPIPRALSFVRANILPSPKRSRSPESTMDLEVSSVEGSEPSRSRGIDLEVDVDVKRSDGLDIDPKIQAEIDECIAYADALRARGVDVRVVVETVDREEIEASMRGPVEVRVDRVTRLVVADDIPEPAQEGAVEVTYETLGDSESCRSKRRELRVQREMRQIRRFRFYDRMRIARLRLVPGGIWATFLRLFLEYPIGDPTVRTRDTARNLEPFMGDGGGKKEVNGNGGNGNGGNGNEGNGNRGNGNGGNGSGNGNGGGNGYKFGGFMPAQECTYQDFLKCQPLSFNGTERVVGLTHWFEKMETVFHISNCPENFQVKYAT
ncbi:hypothetical protein Tco_1012037 [Tanacetum coccineum]